MRIRDLFDFSPIFEGWRYIREHPSLKPILLIKAGIGLITSLAAREAFRKRAIANPREVFDFVYEKLTPELEEQRRGYLEKLGRKGIE